MFSIVWSEGEGREEGGRRKENTGKVDMKTGERWLDYDKVERWLSLCRQIEVGIYTQMSSLIVM